MSGMDGAVSRRDNGLAQRKTLAAHTFSELTLSDAGSSVVGMTKVVAAMAARRHSRTDVARALAGREK